MVKSTSKAMRAQHRVLFGSVTGIIALSSLIVFLVCSTGSYIVKNGGAAAVVTASLVTLLNTDRADNNLPTLTVNPVLTAVAQAKADDMAKLGYFAHNSPEGKTPWYWFKQEGYSFVSAGENLAIDFSDSADVERAWMNSPGHRANLLNTTFTEVGIATAVGNYNGHKTTFVVQAFGTPAKSPQKIEQTFATPKLATEIAIATTKPVAPKVVGVAASPKQIVAKQATTTEISVSTSTNKTTEVATTSKTILGESAPTRVDESSNTTSLYQKIKAYIVTSLGSPKLTLRHAFYLLGTITLLAFLIEGALEIRRNHPKHVVISVVLLLIMAGLFFTANTLLFPKPILLQTGTAITE